MKNDRALIVSTKHQMQFNPVHAVVVDMMMMMMMVNKTESTISITIFVKTKVITNNISITNSEPFICRGVGRCQLLRGAGQLLLLIMRSFLNLLNYIISGGCVWGCGNASCHTPHASDTYTHTHPTLLVI